MVCGEDKKKGENIKKGANVLRRIKVFIALPP
jgi:hypothetical protein